MSRFVIAVLPNWCVVPDKTYRDVEKAIAWSWRAALEGVWPSHNHLGEPLQLVDGDLRHHNIGKPLCAFEPRYRLAFVGTKVLAIRRP